MTNDHGVSFCSDCKKDYSWLFHDRGICSECEEKKEKRHDDKIRAEGMAQGALKTLEEIEKAIPSFSYDPKYHLSRPGLMLWIATKRAKLEKGASK